MRYLSIDLEATGLREHDLIIEFAMVPFDTDTLTIEENLSKHWYIKCPSFEELKPKLDSWVIEHNEGLIRKAHSEGITLSQFKNHIKNYVESAEIKDYFGKNKTENGKKPERITLFGKSMNAIDLPFLSRDLGWDFMREQFNHRDLDLSSISRCLIDLNLIPVKSASGSELMKYLGLGEVKHTALADAINTAKMYLKMIEKIRSNVPQ